jgi:hypothetical protein
MLQNWIIFSRIPFCKHSNGCISHPSINLFPLNCGALEEDWIYIKDFQKCLPARQHNVSLAYEPHSGYPRATFQPLSTDSWLERIVAQAGGHSAAFTMLRFENLLLFRNYWKSTTSLYLQEITPGICTISWGKTS